MMYRQILFLLVLLGCVAGCTQKAGGTEALFVEASRLNERLVATRAAAERIGAAGAEIFSNPSRYDQPLRPERRYATYEGALVYSREPDGKSSILGTGATPVVGEVLRKLKRIEHLEPVLQREVAQNGDASMAWFATSESLGVFWPPYDMVALVPPRLDVQVDILPYRKAAEGNPTGGPVWLEPYVDITGKGYMVTVSRPSRDGEGKTLGVAGVDVAIEPLVKDFAGERFADRMLISSESYVLAAGERISRALGVESLGQIYYLRQVEKDVPAPEKYRLDQSGDARLKALGNRLRSVGESDAIPWGDKILQLKAVRLQETGWLLVEGVLK